MSDTTPAEAPEVEAWHRALQAGMQAQRDFRAERLGNPAWDSGWDDEAEAVLEAVWPHIASYERSEQKETCAQLVEREALADKKLGLHQFQVRLNRVADLLRQQEGGDHE